MIKKTYRPDEVAEILRISRRTVYRMIKDGRLATAAPGVNRIPAVALEELLNDSLVNYLPSNE